MNELGILKGSKKEINERISKTDLDKNYLQNTTGDSQNKNIDMITIQQIDNLVKEIYQIALAERAEQSKSINGSTLQLLTEVEKSLDTLLLDFFVDEQIDGKVFNEEYKTIHREQRSKYIQEYQVKIKKQNEEKARKRQEEKNAKQVKVHGRQAKMRSNKPEVNKVVEEKEDLNEEQLDIKKYLGI